MISQFSKRTDWKTEPNELSAKLERLKSSGVSIIDLTESNPTRCRFQYLNSAWLVPFNDPSNLAYEPAPMGILRARQVIQNDYRAKNIHISPDQIFLTSSTSDAYSSIFRLLLNPNDRILIPQPSYPLFQFLADLNDVAIDRYPLIYDGEWRIDLNRLANEIKKETKAIVLVHPNNPTGSYVKKSELKELVKIAKEKSIALISDEVFYDYNLEENSGRAGSLAENKEVLTFTLGGISKMLGLPQMKLAWTVINGPEHIVADALERLEIIQDTFLSVNTPVQNALESWFARKNEAQEEIKNRIKENQNFFKSLLDAQQQKRGQVLNLRQEPVSFFEYLEPEGSWYGILKLPNTQSEEAWVMQLLEEDHVFVHPGYFFDFEDGTHAVISLIVEPNAFQKGVSRILKRIRNEAGAPQTGLN
jgi:alanine-synthesizing transaminase